MAKNEKFLTIDIGATSVKLCEFEIDRSGQMSMSIFAYREYEEELTDDTRADVIEGVLRQMLMENNVKARKVLLSLSGQSALIRFGKINIIKYDRKQIRQMAEFEAKRNIPFALDEISLDYQLIAPSETDQENRTIDVLSIIIKNDVVNMATQIMYNVGLKPILIDVAPIACYNAARANNIGEEACELIVSIGGRSTNLMFIEGDRFFARTIPIAGYSITQQIAKEFNMTIPEAEELKRHHGFVALDPEKNSVDTSRSTANNVSRIIRNVMTRLYGEISRSINIYRAQQHGSAPVKMYLTGGSAILTYCNDFFAEKFNIPVEYFNPLRAVALAPQIDREKLGEIAHTLSEPIGLAFRYTTNCPIEINMLPRTVQRQQALNAKFPYFVASMTCIVALFGIIYTGMKFSVVQSEERQQAYAELWKKYEKPFKDVKSEYDNAESAKNKLGELRTMMTARAIWPMIIEEIYRAKPDNVWIDSIEPIFGEVKARKEETVIKDTSGSVNPNEMLGGLGDLDMSSMNFDMGGMMGSTGEGKTIAKTSIGGFTIKAHTIQLYGVTTGVDPQLPPEPVYPFEAPEASGDTKNDTASSAEGDGSENTLNLAAPEQYDQSGENLFVRNLRKSRLFSKEELMTTIMNSRMNKILRRNARDFEIQLKLELKVEAYPWVFPQSFSGTERSGVGRGRAMPSSGRRSRNNY